MNAVTDGFGNSWPRCELNECGLHVVRPGKVQCWCDDAKGEVLALRRHSADQGLTLATLCDLILGEGAGDRSDTALIRGASALVRGRDELLHKMQRLRNEVARLNNQTMWVCACGGTDCAGQKENAALRSALTFIRSTTDESGLSQAQIIETIGKCCDEVLP